MRPTLTDFQFWAARQADARPTWARAFPEADGPTIHRVIAVHASPKRYAAKHVVIYDLDAVNAMSLAKLAARHRPGGYRQALRELANSPHRDQFPKRTAYFRRWLRRLEAQL